MLNWVEHEKSFITSGPDFKILQSTKQAMLGRILTLDVRDVLFVNTLLILSVLLCIYGKNQEVNKKKEIRVLIFWTPEGRSVSYVLMYLLKNFRDFQIASSTISFSKLGSNFKWKYLLLEEKVLITLKRRRGH